MHARLTMTMTMQTRRHGPEDSYWTEEAGRRFVAQQDDLVMLREDNERMRKLMESGASRQTAPHHTPDRTSCRLRAAEHTMPLVHAPGPGPVLHASHVYAAVVDALSLTMTMTGHDPA